MTGTLNAKINLERGMKKMRKVFEKLGLLVAGASLLLAASCSSPTNPPPPQGGGDTPSGEHKLLSFGLVTPALQGVVDDASATVSLSVPYGVSLDSLVATFTVSSEASVFVGLTPQTSGVTANNFSSPVTYRVVGKDGQFQDYVVTITQRAAKSGKELLSMSTVGPDLTGIVDQAAKTVTFRIPSGTTINNQVKVYFTLSEGALLIVKDQVMSPETIAAILADGLEMTVQAEDGSVQTYTLKIVNPPADASSDAKLETLEVAGIRGLTFTPEVTEYQVAVEPGTDKITLNTEASDASGAVILINGALSSDGVVPLKEGENVVEVTVVAANGESKTYTLTVTRPVTESTDNSLASLSLSSGVLSPAFASGIYNYSVTVDNSITAVSVSALPSDVKAKVAVSGGQDLLVGSNTITITVTSQSGSVQTYTISVTRAASLSTNNNLASLSLSAGSLSPAFSAGNTSYNATVANSVTSVTVAAQASDSGATLAITGGQNLAVGSNTISVAVTSKSGAVKTYTIIVTRSAPLSTNNDLASLSLSSGTLSPAFSASTLSYTAQVPNSVTSLTVAALASDGEATVVVNGGQTLAVGANSITVAVTSKSGAVKTYTVTVTRAPAVSTNNNLASLSLSAGTLSPLFTQENTSYTASVANSVTTVTVAATAADTGATVVVTGGQTLAVGPNVLTVAVTSKSGAVKTYTITVTRAATETDGTFSLTITDDLKGISITLSGLKNSLAAGESMTVKATASEAVSKYTWYLNGAQQGSTTDTISVGSGLTKGSYNLNLVVETATKLASATVAFTVAEAQENGSASITIDASTLTLYSVALTGGTASLVQNTTMTLTAAATLAPDTYTWYLDGKVIAGASAATYTVPGTTAVGFHRIDVVAKKGTKLASAYFEFTVTASQIQTVATPTFSVPAGEVDSGTTVTFASTTAGVTFHYTLDGTNPTTSSTSGTSVTLTEAKTVKVMAVKSGMNNSQVASASYTIKPVVTGITIQIPATYGEDAIHYWAVTASPGIADSVWATPVMLTAKEAGWKGYTLPNATAAKFLIRKVNGAQTPNQEVTAAGVYYMHHNGTAWVLSTTKPAL